MHNEQFLTHDLTFQKDGNQKKYLGVCKLPNQPGSQNTKHRRLDIIVVPPTEKATAMLYFTGSAHFNRSMRLMATKKGMSLSEHALRKNVIRMTHIFLYLLITLGIRKSCKEIGTPITSG